MPIGYPGIGLGVKSILFMATEDKTVANTSTETSAFGNGVGSKTVPANVLKAGTNIVFAGGGFYSVPIVTPGNFTVRLTVNGVVVATCITSTLVGNITNAGFEFSAVLAVRSVGTSGVIQPVGGLNFGTTAGSRVFGDLMNNGLSTTVNTTIDLPLDVTIQWQTASTSRTITITASSIALEQ